MMSYSMRHEAARAIERDSRGSWRNAIFLAAGAALAASALVVRQRVRQAEQHHPPAGAFIDVAGVRLHYVERGQGQPLVLLHGNGSMIQDFESSGLLELAAKKYRVIAFDRPGYGYSERPRGKTWTPQAQAELLHRALLYLDVEQPILVAHSWATLVAVSFALQFPDHVKGLVLMSGYYYPSVRADVPLMSLPAIPGIGDLMRHTVSPLFARAIWPLLLRRIFGPAPVPERFSAEFPVWLALRPSQLRASAAETGLLIPSAFSLCKHYQELNVPVALMAGDGDRHVDTHAQSARLYEELPRSTLELARGAGHMLHHFAPEQVMDAIEQLQQSGAGVQAAQKQEKHIFPAPAAIN